MNESLIYIVFALLVTSVSV